MTAPRDPDVLIREFLGEGQTELPDRAFETVRHEIHRTRQRAVIGPWRTPSMNTLLKMALAAAAVVVIVVAGINLTPRDEGRIGRPNPASPTPLASASPVPGRALQDSPMRVSGTEADGTPLNLTVDLPPGWLNGGIYAEHELAPPSGIAFFLSVVDNTMSDPCASVGQSPKVGSTAGDLATALGEIAGTSATQPVKTTVAGYEATYVEVRLPATLPCPPSKFVLWQDGPGGGDWYALAPNELFRVWIIDVAGERVVLTGRSYPETSEAAKAELPGIFDSIVFDDTPTEPSASPSPS